MVKARILDIISKSPKFPNPPHELLGLVGLSFAKNVQGKEIYPLVIEHRDKITDIVCSKFFNNRVKSNSFKDILASSHPKDLRNILFSLWMLRFESAGRYDAIDYNSLHQSWLLSAVFGYTLGKFLGIGNPSDLFLQCMLQDVSLLALSRAVPEVYSRLDKVPAKTRHLEKAEERSAGIRHADLSADIIASWGFPEEFYDPIRMHHHVEDYPDVETLDKTAARITGFCMRLAEIVMQSKKAIFYTEIEDLFSRYFRRPAADFPSFLRMALLNAKNYAHSLGLQKMPNFSGLRVLKENTEFLKRRLIPYEEMLEELVVVYDKLEKLEAQLEKNESQQTAYLLRDVLTGLSNHVYFQEALKQEVAKSNRYEQSLSLIVFDIDNFRQINQAYGITTGNAILKDVSDILRKNLRESDLLSRYGNDEFAIAVPHVGKLRANVIAEKLRRRVSEHSFANPQRDLHHKITISVGHVSLEPKEEILDKSELLKRVFKALSTAKRAGGNRSVAADANYKEHISAE